MFVVLALDVILAGVGIAMILSYLSARRDATSSVAPPRPDAGVVAEVEVLPPQPVAAQPAAGTADAPAAKVSRTAVKDRKAGASSATRSTGAAKAERSEREAPTGGGDSDDAAGSGSAERKGAGSRTAPDPRPKVGRAGDRADSDETADSPLEEPTAGSADAPTPDDSTDSSEPSEEEVSRFAARIDAVVDRHQGQLHRCYERAAKSASAEEPVEGRVDIRFRIMPSGSAQRVRPVGNTTGSSALANCLVEVVKSWSFPEGASAPLDFVWPFVFRAQRS